MSDAVRAARGSTRRCAWTFIILAAHALLGCKPHYDSEQLERFFRPLVRNLPDIARRVSVAFDRALASKRDVRALTRSPTPSMVTGEIYNTEFISLDELKRPRSSDHHTLARQLGLSANLATALSWTAPLGGEVTEGNWTLQFASALRYAIVIGYVQRPVEAPREAAGRFAGTIACALVTLPRGRLVNFAVVTIAASEAHSADAAQQALVEKLGRAWGVRLTTVAATEPRRGLSRRTQRHLGQAGLLCFSVLLIGLLLWRSRGRRASRKDAPVEAADKAPIELAGDAPMTTDNEVDATSLRTTRVEFASDDETPFFCERLARGYAAALAAAVSAEPPGKLPEPSYRAGDPEPHADAPPWERYRWRWGELDLHVETVPRFSQHGVHGSEMTWTLRHEGSDLELTGFSEADARSSYRVATLDLSPIGDAARRAATDRAFRSAFARE